MTVRLSGIKVSLSATQEELYNEVIKKLGLSPDCIIGIKPYRKSLDCRGNGEPFYIYTLDVKIKSLPNQSSNDFTVIDENLNYQLPTVTTSSGKLRPIVVGFGPAGMFCALVLAKCGLPPIIIERGKQIEERQSDVKKFFLTSDLDTNSNIQFGEGGAGAFSDGKLTTLVKDKNYRGRFVLEEFVKSGAPEEILYLNKPHIGTDKLKAVVANIRKTLISLGSEFYFGHTASMIDIKNNKIHGVYAIDNSTGEEKYFNTDSVFLGIGHSARDTFGMLKSLNVPMQKKPFAVGVRIEHPQHIINKSQYGTSYLNPKLPPADYKLAYRTSDNRSVYSFCMCPGGYVVAATSEKNSVVTNGMSDYMRDGINANSALLVGVSTEDIDKLTAGTELYDSILGGMNYQGMLEQNAYKLAGSSYAAPISLLGDFLNNKSSTALGSVKPTYCGKTVFCNLRELFPNFINESLAEGIKYFGTCIRGFDMPDAILTAVESRTSSPVRILRGENMQSDVEGIYPIGEGSGYAGGIMSAAMDGMKAAEAYIENTNN